MTDLSAVKAVVLGKRQKEEIGGNMRILEEKGFESRFKAGEDDFFRENHKKY